MPQETVLWVASVETEHTRSIAFGTTPEQALAAFVELWVERHCPAGDAEASYPWDLKGGIAIDKAVMGRGYLLGNGDEHWFRETVRGDDPRLEATWDALAGRYGIFPATPDDASYRLREAFSSLGDAVASDGTGFGKDQGLVETAMREVAVLVAEDPATVDAPVLAQAAESLRNSFDALRTLAVMEPDPATRDRRRDHARLCHRTSYDVARFSNAIAGMRGPSPKA